MSLKLRINGELRPISVDAAPIALDRVLTVLLVRKELIAVAVNDSIVPRTQWSHTWLSESDRVEIVHFVGGGSASTRRVELLRR